MKKKWVVVYSVGENFSETIGYSNEGLARGAAAHLSWVYRNHEGVNIEVVEKEE